VLGPITCCDPKAPPRRGITWIRISWAYDGMLGAPLASQQAVGRLHFGPESPRMRSSGSCLQVPIAFLHISQPLTWSTFIGVKRAPPPWGSPPPPCSFSSLYSLLPPLLHCCATSGSVIFTPIHTATSTRPCRPTRGAIASARAPHASPRASLNLWASLRLGKCRTSAQIHDHLRTNGINPGGPGGLCTWITCTLLV